MHMVNKQNPDLPRTPIYRRCFLSPKPAVSRSFTVLTLIHYLNFTLDIAAELKCSVPTIPGGKVSPETEIPLGSTFTITCNEGHTLKPGSETTVECTEGGNTGETQLLDLPTCDEGMIQFVLLLE